MTTNSKMLRPIGMVNHNSGVAIISTSVERRHQSRLRQSMDDRLSRVKSTVDCHHSQSFPHISANLGRRQAMAEQEQRISKENTILLKKLTDISNSERPRSGKLLYSSVNGIRLTVDGTPKIDNHKERFVGVKGPVSRARRAALEDISLQNVKLAAKLRNVEGVYSSREFRKTKQLQENYLSMHRPRRVANKPFTPCRSWDSTPGPSRQDSSAATPRQSRHSTSSGQHQVLTSTAQRLRESQVGGLRKAHSDDGQALLPPIDRTASPP